MAEAFIQGDHRNKADCLAYWGKATKQKRRLENIDKI
jgi:hypothetical protein